MWSDYAFSAEAKTSLPFTLEVVYAVDADASFDALKLPTEGRRRALIRNMSGEGELVLANAEPIILRAGTLFLVDFNLVRRYRPRNGAWRFWYFEFECGDELALPLGQVLALPELARDEADAKDCLEALRREEPAEASLASAIFAMMYHRWLATWTEGNEARHPREDSIREAVAEMRRNLDRPLSIPFLAAHCNMSERSFRDAFEAVMEWPPKRYFDRLRLEKGAELLRLNRYSIGEIADQLGYSSAFHFSHAFRELFGVPPSTYASVIRSQR
jgi:AraC-like DNA-binding protein